MAEKHRPREKKDYSKKGKTISPGGKPGPSRVKRKSDEPELIRLNKYIANAGICSRREADKLIQSGVIEVNGKIVKDLGTKVSAGDVVKFDNRRLKSEKKYYVLLNKPKGYLTTTDDPFDRKTVMNLVSAACRERIYPVGRLDRDTTGLLMFTNDGELAKKLTHPRHNIRKIYHVVLDKSITKTDMKKIADGLTLDDGPVTVDKISYVSDSSSRKELGIELHSGKNRIVRRIFESQGYKVQKLDRVIFAGLTKKDIPRGKWRYLTDKEVNYLKML
jgi:23S rRNA pseudouridine2605 synthase